MLWNNQGGVALNQLLETVLLFYETKEPFHVEIKVPWYGLKHEYFNVSIDFILQRQNVLKM